MALDLTATYPDQIDDGDVAYPQGKAVNITVKGDGTGTPWERQIVNDWLGFFQSLLDEGGISPSGNPDEVGASDYLDALFATFFPLDGSGTMTGLADFDAGIDVEGGATVDTLDATGNVSVDGTLTVTDTTGGSIATDGGLVVDGTATLGTLVVDGQGFFNDTLEITSGGFDVTGDSGLTGNLLVLGSVAVTGGNPFSCNGTSTFSGPVVLDAAGSIRVRAVEGLDSNVTYDVETRDVVYVSNTKLTGAREYTVADGDANGDQIQFYTDSTAHALTIKDSGGGTIITLLHTTGNFFWCQLTWIGSLSAGSGAWAVTAAGRNDS